MKTLEEYFLSHCSQTTVNLSAAIKIAQGFIDQHKTLEQLETERMVWSRENFTEATAISSLEKLKGEIRELEDAILFGDGDDLDEGVDCLKCILDVLGRRGYSVEQITAGFAKKLAKNKARKWKKNPDNTYSHVKA